MLLKMALFHSFFMTEEYSIVYMYHIFLIHSSVDGHIGSSQILAIVNSAAINIGVHVFFQIVIFSGWMSGVGLHDHMVAPFFGF